MSINTMLYNIRSKYSAHGVDFNKVLNIWKQSNLDHEDIRFKIFDEIGVKLNIAEAKFLHKVARTSNGSEFETHEATNIFNSLKDKRAVKLTPSIKQALEKVDNNVYRIKSAGIEISWAIDMRDGVPWLKRISNPQEETTIDDSVKKEASMKRADEISMDWEQYYWKSGLGDMFMEEYHGELPEKLRKLEDIAIVVMQGFERKDKGLLQILEIAEENKDEIEYLKDRLKEEEMKRKKYRDMYENGEIPVYEEGPIK